MIERDTASRRHLIDYWNEQREAIPFASKRIWQRRLDTERVLGQPTCLLTGIMTLSDAIELILIDEDALAPNFLEHAELYIRTAIERDDIGGPGHEKEADLVRASRLRSLVLILWLKDGHFRVEEFRESCEFEDHLYRRLFPLSGWEDLGYRLSEWMLHLIVAERATEALTVFNQYFKGDRYQRRRAAVGAPEEVLNEVARAIVAPEDSGIRLRAETRFDQYYARITDWPAKENLTEIPLDEKLLYAFVRGRHFKGTTDPVRLIKMMKLGE